MDRDRHRRIVHALTRLHEATADATLDGLCPLADRYRLFAPEVVGPWAGGDFVLPPLVLRGWEHFGNVVPPDVSEAVGALHASTGALARRLLERETVLVHGDLRLANLALTPERVVLFDWGALTTIAPPAVE